MRNFKPLLIPAIAGLLLIGIGLVIHEEDLAFDFSLYPILTRSSLTWGSCANQLEVSLSR